ncbi:hypothetical protein LTR27_011374 [Elasticomyces elasticus]|nr:hypothetical protein LTR27_011374 [Elasticomyces elasticus]
MADEVAGDYFGRWVNAEREVFELKNKLAKQQDIIAKVANSVVTAGHDATSAEITLLKNESAMKQKQIEDLESSLRAKDTSRVVEVEKLIAEIDGLKLELANERTKQHEVKEVPESEVEDECAAVLTPTSSVSEQEIVEQDGRSQHPEEAVATVPLVAGFEHDEQNTISSDETPAVVVAKPLTADEVFEACANDLEKLAERNERSVGRKAEKAIEREWLDIRKKYQDLLDTALPEVWNTLYLNLDTDVQAQELVEKLHEENRVFRAVLRFLSIEQQESSLKARLAEMEHRMVEYYQVKKYPVLEPIIASFMRKLEAVLRA